MPTGTSARAPLDVGRAREAHPLLEPLKARAPLVVERDDLTVQEEPRERQRAQGVHDLRVLGGEDLAAPAAQLDLVVGARGEHPDAVVLDLEEPVRLHRRCLDERREHDQLAAQRDVGARGTELGEAPAQALDPLHAVAQLLDRQA